MVWEVDETLSEAFEAIQGKKPGEGVCWHGRGGSRPARSRLLPSRNIQEVVQLSEGSEAPRPTQEICGIQFTSAPLQNGERIFKQ